MARMWSTLLCAFVAASLVTIAAGACSLPTAFTSGYSGDGTYYGAYTNGGACSLDPTPPIASGLATVAIGGGVWAGSQTCGMCLNLTGSGEGSGANPITGSRIVFVNNICPECQNGLDLGLKGDGRWKISWKAVPCPVGSANFQYKFQGSHSYYIKLQVRNTRYPVSAVSVIQNGAAKPLARADDNFWLSGGTVSYPLTGKFSVQITSVTGDTVTDELPYVSSNNNEVIDGKVQFPLCGSGSTATATTSTTKSATTSTTSATSTTKSATTASTSATSTTKSATTSATTSTTSATTSTTKSATSTTTGGSTTGSSSYVDVYTDEVVSPLFESWSWGTFTAQSTAFAQSGSKSFLLNPSNWAAAYFRFKGTGGISTSVYKSIEFYIYSPIDIPSTNIQFAVVKGDAGSAGVRIKSYIGGADTIKANTWTKGNIPLSGFANGPFDGFWFQGAENSATLPVVYLDSIKLFKN